MLYVLWYDILEILLIYKYSIWIALLYLLRHFIVYVQVSIKSCLLISGIISEKFSKLWHLESKHMPEIVQKWGEFRKEWHIVFKSYDSKCSSSYSWASNNEVKSLMNLHSIFVLSLCQLVLKLQIHCIFRL